MVHAPVVFGSRHASKVCSVQIQATASAYAASIVGPTAEPEDDRVWGWPDAASLQPTCDLPVAALGLSKKVLQKHLQTKRNTFLNDAQQQHSTTQQSR